MKSLSDLLKTLLKLKFLLQENVLDILLFGASHSQFLNFEACILIYRVHRISGEINSFQTIPASCLTFDPGVISPVCDFVVKR